MSAGLWVARVEEEGPWFEGVVENILIKIRQPACHIIA